MDKVSLKQAGRFVATILGMSSDELMSCFRTAHESDVQHVLSLRRKVDPTKETQEDERYLRWRYRFAGPDKNCIWLFERQSALLGVVGIEHTQIHIEGKWHPAVRAMDIMVNPEINGSGLGVWMNLAIFQKYPLIYVTGGNKDSTNLLKKLFHPMPSWKSWIYPANARPFIAKRFPRLAKLTNGLLPAANSLLFLRNFYFKPAVPKHLEFAKVARFDKRVDRLVEGAANRGWVLAKRDADSLNWRFATNPGAYEILTCSDAGELLAYCVFRRNFPSRGATKSSLLVDWLARTPPELDPQDTDRAARNEDSLATLLSWLFNRSARDMTSDRIDFIATSAYDPVSQSALRKAGFIRTPWTKGFYIVASDAKLHASLISSDRWYLTGFDQDTV